MRVILHIGQHKTGSKALQSALYANRGFLARHGYRYSVQPKARRLRPYEMNHHGLFVILRQAMASASPGGQRLTAVKRYLQKLITVKNTDHHTVIFSCEDLFDMHTAHESELKIERISEAITILAEVFNALKVELNIVCYLRRQDHLLGAHYAQFIKGSSTHWLSINDYARLAAPRLCYDRILGLWETGFGIDAIRALAYERQRMPAGIVGAFFEDVLKLGRPPIMNPFLNDLEAFNISPSKRYIDYIRILNKRTCRGEDTLPRHQVLEAAFQDHDHSPSGISAFLSPCQRAELLTRHDEGNRRIARRYGSGEILFSEPEPHASDPWIPPASLDLTHLVDLDTKVRGLKANKACWHHALATLRRQLTPRVLWIVPPSTEPEDLCLAASLFAGLAGSPDAESRLHPILPERLIRSRTIILVGLRAAESLGTECQRRLRKRRSRTLLLLGSATCAMVDRQHLERCAAVADAVVFANLDLRDSVVSDHPIWRTIRVEPLESSEHPDQEFLAHFALTQPKPTAQRHACRR